MFSISFALFTFTSSRFCVFPSSCAYFCPSAYFCLRMLCSSIVFSRNFILLSLLKSAMATCTDNTVLKVARDNTCYSVLDWQTFPPSHSTSLKENMAMNRYTCSVVCLGCRKRFKSSRTAWRHMMNLHQLSIKPVQFLDQNNLHVLIKQPCLLSPDTAAYAPYSEWLVTLQEQLNKALHPALPSMYYALLL